MLLKRQKPTNQNNTQQSTETDQPTLPPLTKEGWLSELKQIRENAERKDRLNSQPGEEREVTIDQLLRESRAFEFLRDIKKQVLGGVGTIELFENAGGYDLVLVLMWDGPIHSPRHPKSKSKERHHIFVGIHQNQLWVNGYEVENKTPQALQQKLIEAIKHPGRRKNLKNNK